MSAGLQPGDRVGRRTVIDIDRPADKRMYVVRCDCGRVDRVECVTFEWGWALQCERCRLSAGSPKRPRAKVYPEPADYDLPAFLRAVTPDTCAGFGACRAMLRGEG